jgi:hypothetical protein
MVFRPPVLPWSISGARRWQVQVSSADAETRPSFLHSAFLYEGDAAYVAMTSAFIRDGLARGEAVAVAADARHTGLLRDRLAGDATEVRFLPAEEWYVRPVRTIAGWARLLRAAATEGRPFVRLIGHHPVDHGTPPWVRFESALNTSLAGLRGHLLCPYDRATMSAEEVLTAGRTHPRVHDRDWRDSAGYEPPEALMAGLPEQARTTLEALVPHPARLGRPSEYALLVSQLIANPLLNGEVIRLDGALRMPPR